LTHTVYVTKQNIKLLAQIKGRFESSSVWGSPDVLADWA